MNYELCFTVTPDHKLYNLYNQYLINRTTWIDFFNEFAQNHNIKATEFAMDRGKLLIVPTEEDSAEFQKLLISEKGGLSSFRKNSKIAKEWVKRAADLPDSAPPKLFNYFSGLTGRFRESKFAYNNLLYCKLSYDLDLHLDSPESQGFKSIKISEWHMALEAYEDSIKQK